jgi:hypothetical protein
MAEAHTRGSRMIGYIMNFEGYGGWERLKLVRVPPSPLRIHSNDIRTSH